MPASQKRDAEESPLPTSGPFRFLVAPQRYSSIPAPRSARSSRDALGRSNLQPDVDNEDICNYLRVVIYRSLSDDDDAEHSSRLFQGQRRNIEATRRDILTRLSGARCAHSVRGNEVYPARAGLSHFLFFYSQIRTMEKLTLSFFNGIMYDTIHR